MTKQVTHDWNGDWQCTCGQKFDKATDTASHIKAAQIGLNLDGRFTVADMPGVAFYLLGFTTEWTEESWELFCEEDHEHDESCYLYNEPEEVINPQSVRAVMVGDDHEHIVDVDGLTEIGEEDYCPECGQTGCRAYR